MEDTWQLFTIAHKIGIIPHFIPIRKVNYGLIWSIKCIEKYNFEKIDKEITLPQSFICIYNIYL